MEEQNKEVEQQEAAPKNKKSGALKLLYWLVVIGGCTFIFLGSYKIGYKLGNYFGEKKSEVSTTKKSNETSNTTSNVESNSNVTDTTKYSGTYNGNLLFNSQTNEYKLYELSFDENNKVSFSYGMISNNGGSGISGYTGTYEVKDNKLVMTATDEITTIGTNKLSSSKTLEFALGEDDTFTYNENEKNIVISKGKDYTGKYFGTATNSKGTYEFSLELNSADNKASYTMSVPNSEGISYTGSYYSYNEGVLFVGDKAIRSGGETEETNVIYFKVNADGTFTFSTINTDVTLKK